MSIQPSRADAPALRPPFRIDAHAHVFDDTCPMSPDRRYTPPRPRPLGAYLAELDAAELTHAVLVQPSFLGTDNGYLLSALEAEPDRLRGVAVVDPTVADATLARMARAGVVGVRYNLIGRDPATVRNAEWRALSRRVAGLGWHLEVQAEGPDLARVLPELLKAGGPVVVDHFGRPDPAAGIEDAGFQALLAAARDGAPVWAKLSAPYRCHGADVDPYAERLLKTLGPERLLWGSDWPWTQHEAGKSYAQVLGWLERWVPDAAMRQAILAAPASLMGFVRG